MRACVCVCACDVTCDEFTFSRNSDEVRSLRAFRRLYVRQNTMTPENASIAVLIGLLLLYNVASTQHIRNLAKRDTLSRLQHILICFLHGGSKITSKSD